MADLERQYKRSQELVAQNFIAKSAADATLSQLEAQRAAVAADRAAVQSAQVALGYATLRSPIAGRIGAVNIYPGTLVQPSLSLVTITQLDPIAVSFPVPEGKLQDLLAAARAHAPVEALVAGRKTPLKGALNFVDNTVDPTDRHRARQGGVRQRRPGPVARPVRRDARHRAHHRGRHGGAGGRDDDAGRRQLGLRGRCRQDGRPPQGRGAPHLRRAGRGARRGAGRAGGDRRQAERAPGRQGARSMRRPRRSGPAARRPRPRPAARPRSRLPTPAWSRNGSAHEHLRALHPSSCDDGAAVCRGRWWPASLPTSSIPVAALPSYNTPVINVNAQLPGASPGHHGLVGRAAAREAVLHHSRAADHQLGQHPGRDLDHARVREQPRHRRGRGRRAGGAAARAARSCRSR